MKMPNPSFQRTAYGGRWNSNVDALEKTLFPIIFRRKVPFLKRFRLASAGQL